MLFILTGHIQTGKTRWLQALIRDLEAADVALSGVVAPGIWVEHKGEFGGIDYEKLGITNELLPSHEVIQFAMRDDLAEAHESCRPDNHHHGKKLMWRFSDEAMAQVNDHFASYLDGSAPVPDAPGLLVVDELGRLELVGDEGLTNAMKLISAGPSPYAKHALIVVREMLVELALEKLACADAWGGAALVYPTKADARAVKAAF